jgi:hypothetical protein
VPGVVVEDLYDTNTARRYALFVGREHSVAELREILRSLRGQIERLEKDMQYSSKPGFATRQRISEAKLQVIVLLAKLAELDTRQ